MTSARFGRAGAVQTGVGTGYFVIADISGYTSFLTSTELSHAQGILHELISLLIDQLAAPFEFVELEGDAVFVYAPAARVSDAEHLLTLIETCYGAFALRRDQMVRNSTCACSACRTVSGLDLKFVAHYGQYVEQPTPRGAQLVGTDVVLVHRLLKNRVSAATGLRSYALLTQPFVEGSRFSRPEGSLAASAGGLGLIPHEEEIASFGVVPTHVADLAETVERYRQRYRSELDAHPVAMEIVTPIEAPVQQVWGYVTDPDLRPLWQKDIRSIRVRPGRDGRTGVGWESHCDHGGYVMRHRIVDWNPYEQITMHTEVSGRSPTRPWPCQAEFHFAPLSSSSCALTFRVRLRTSSRLRRFVFWLIRPMLRREWRGHFSALRALFPAQPPTGDGDPRVASLDPHPHR